MRGRVMVIVGVCALVAACDGRDPDRRKVRAMPTAPPAIASSADCLAAAHGALGSPGGTGLGDDANARLRAAREEVIVRLCAEDEWSLEAADCYARAEGMRELGRCRLPPEASKRLSAELMRTMQLRLGLPH